MMAKRTTGLLYLLVLWVIISALTWPVFVAVSSILAFIAAEGWQLDAISLIPKRHILAEFLAGYKNSLLISIPMGFVAVVDYLLLSRYRITWLLGGMLLPLAGVVIAYTLYKHPMDVLPSLVLSGIVLAITHRLIDLLAGHNSRGRLR